ncbi:MAG TPA: hypothetical protein VEA58_05570 [Anaerovoracaceae bacterium]|nr:hypothetical protein [Anaerovoracaceae bacterium]
MKKKLIAAFVGFLVSCVLLAGCSSGEEAETNGMVVGENAFEIGIYLKCDSSEEAKFFVEPTRDDLRATVEEGWKDGGMSSGNFGTLALVEGKKKGEKADLDGSFTVFVNDSSGPSATVAVKGTYVIDELTGFENSYFFLYTDDGLKQVAEQEWKDF